MAGFEGDGAVVGGEGAGGGSEEDGGGGAGLIEVAQGGDGPAGAIGGDAVDGGVEGKARGGGGKVVELRCHGAFELCAEDEGAAAEADDRGIDGDEQAEPEVDLEDRATQQEALRVVKPGAAVMWGELGLGGHDLGLGERR